ncbi:MAG: sulfurtransferase TusA family protein [Nitrosomonas sp.]|nr:sulfurtransferase TusA family protein [Nitrosomonas sp.]
MILQLNTCGPIRPFPILYTKNSLVRMISGQILKIVTTNAGAVIDFQIFAEQTGNELL